jgi:2-polyprenyl-3-methyl-5-hydroxy-6-metoxy-1,4-benzoquinol methylase
MTPATTGAAYDSIAQWYNDWVGGADNENVYDDPYFPPLFELVGEVAGLRVMDLACGQGRIARALARRGARMVGVDISGELIAIAERYASTDAPVEYRHDSAHALGTCQDSEFDGVIANMAMMDIPDLQATVRSTFRVLRPGGWFAFSTFHPCFNTPQSAELVDDAGQSHRTVTDYFTEGHWTSDQRVGTARTIGAYHRTLATYLNTLVEAGFSLRQVRDVPGPSAIWQQVPPVLAVIVDKPGGSRSDIGTASL